MQLKIAELFIRFPRVIKDRARAPHTLLPTRAAHLFAGLGVNNYPDESATPHAQVDVDLLANAVQIVHLNKSLTRALSLAASHS